MFRKITWFHSYWYKLLSYLLCLGSEKLEAAWSRGRSTVFRNWAAAMTSSSTAPAWAPKRWCTTTRCTRSEARSSRWRPPGCSTSSEMETVRPTSTPASTASLWAARGRSRTGDYRWTTETPGASWSAAAGWSRRSAKPEFSASGSVWGRAGGTRGWRGSWWSCRVAGCPWSTTTVTEAGESPSPGARLWTHWGWSGSALMKCGYRLNYE